MQRNRREQGVGRAVDLRRRQARTMRRWRKMQNLYAKGVNEVYQRHKCKMQNAKCRMFLPFPFGEGGTTSE